MRFSNAGPQMSVQHFMEKLPEEVAETLFAIGYVHGTLRREDDLHVLEEVFDVMQTCYTFLISNFEDSEIKTANNKHMTKMLARYGEV